MKLLVFISHPSGGKEENVHKVEQIIETLYKDKFIADNYCFVSGILEYGFLYDVLTYEEGLECCYGLLEHCNLDLMFGDYKSSKGCMGEIDFCLEHKIPIKVMPSIEYALDFLKSEEILMLLKDR